LGGRRVPFPLPFADNSLMFTVPFLAVDFFGVALVVFFALDFGLAISFLLFLALLASATFSFERYN
jgi:hypothetical protein